MKRLIDILGLSREAILLDSRLYIAKAVLAIATGYIVGKSSPLTRLDMISVLLGVMYNLEPINIIGLRSGVSQLISSALGVACTGILIVLFGINIFTISLSMALTLLVSLKINWRMVSPVAIFTCIYMTQYVQLNADGTPSIWLTFRLRIAALGIGVIIAIFFNFLFSFLYYRKIAYRRLEFARIQLLSGLVYTEKQLRQNCADRNRDYISIFPSIFNDLDLVYSNITTMIKESKHSFRAIQGEKLLTMQKILLLFRDINHLAYDINYILCSDSTHVDINNKAALIIKESYNELEKINLDQKAASSESFGSEAITVDGKDELSDRVYYNLNSINRYIELVRREIKNL